MTAEETIRAAAALMRARAQAANTTETRQPYGDPKFPAVSETEWGGLVNEYLGGELGTYCASWHPATALAVADLVECPCERHAWAVTRAYLDGEQP